MLKKFFGFELKKLGICYIIGEMTVEMEGDRKNESLDNIYALEAKMYSSLDEYRKTMNKSLVNPVFFAEYLDISPKYFNLDNFNDFGDALGCCCVKQGEVKIQNNFAYSIEKSKNGYGYIDKKKLFDISTEEIEIPILKYIYINEHINNSDKLTTISLTNQTTAYGIAYFLMTPKENFKNGFVRGIYSVDSKYRQKNNVVEKICDRFVKELLLPEEEFIKGYKSFNKLDNLICVLAEHFKVDDGLISERMKDLKIEISNNKRQNL